VSLEAAAGDLRGANQQDNAQDQLGERWSGAENLAHPNVFDWRTQASALSALIADAMPK